MNRLNRHVPAKRDATRAEIGSEADTGLALDCFRHAGELERCLTTTVGARLDGDDAALALTHID